MKATVRGYYTYPSAEFPKKWADMRPQEREALKHYFCEVKHPIYVYVRKCKVSSPVEVMRLISVGLMAAPKIRKHIAADYAPRVSQRVNLTPKKTIIKRVGRHPMFWPALATIIIIELGIIVGAYLDTKVVRISYIDPITKIEAEVKKAVEPVKAEAKTSKPVDFDGNKNNAIDRMANYIHGKESTNGTNKNPRALHNLCKAKGQSNEYGMGGMAHKWCYADKAEAKSTVIAWLNKRWTELNGDTKMILCYYNQGLKVRTCPYAKDF